MTRYIIFKVRGELQKEREEKVDLVTEKVQAEEEVSTLKTQIQQVAAPASTNFHYKSLNNIIM